MKNNSTPPLKNQRATFFSITLAMLFFLLIALSPMTAFSQSTPVKILPLGDSITQGDTLYNSYRRPLWHALNDDGYDVDFVGSLTSNAGGAAPDPDFDLDHEGHHGWRADQVLDSLPGWVEGYDFDIVLLHIGHNDLNRVDRNGSVVQATLDDIDGIIDVLRSDNPNVTILLAQLIPSCRPIRDVNIESFNALVPDYAAGKTTTNSPVIVVDHFTGFDANTDTYDCSHPNVTGEQKMADTWQAALTPLLNGSPQPTATVTSTPSTPTETPSPSTTPTNTAVPPTATATVEPTVTQTPTATIEPTVTSTPGAGTSIHIADIDGSAAAPSFRWEATVSLFVVDSSGAPAADAEVEGTWDLNGRLRTGDCTTDNNGECTILLSNIAAAINSITYTVDNINGTLPYDANLNTDPDGDSDGTTIGIEKP